MEARLVLPPRLERELAGLRKTFEGLAFMDAGQWVLLPAYCFPERWSERAAPVAFQVPVGYPGTPPYGFYIPGFSRYDGKVPTWQYPAANKPPFEGDWAFFSWSIDGGWVPPTTDAIGGCNLRSFVDSFFQRLAEGA